ncbi:filaggrin-like [Homarus americanus]|uniref:filaggrin-like n=1 Tax=Homarus americanus TaxID=6706 RepID=UPI001C438FE8|nr:filaggrin-like [Homarus americanus]
MAVIKVVGYLVAAAVVVSATSPPQSPAPAALLDTPLLQEESHTFVQTPQHPDPHLQFSSDEAYPTSLEHGQAFSTPPGQHHGRESEGQSGQDGRGTDLKNYRVQQTQDQTHEQGQPYRQEAFGSQIDGQGPQQEDLQDQTVGADTFSSGSFQRGQAEYPKIPGVSKGVSAAGVGVQGEASQSFRRNFRGGDSDQQQEVPSTLSSRPRGAAVSRGSHKYDEDEQHEDEQDNLKMGNYEYSYNIRSEETGDMKFHQETRDGGKVVGEYRVKEADGTMRVVKYSADKDNGFQATVEYVSDHEEPEYGARMKGNSQKGRQEQRNTFESSRNGHGSSSTRSRSRFQSSRTPQYSQNQDSRASQFQGSRASQFQDSRPSQFQDSRASQFQDSRASQFQDSRASQFQDSRASQFQDSRASQFQGSRVSQFQDSSSSSRQDFSARVPFLHRNTAAARSSEVSDRSQFAAIPGHQDTPRVPQGSSRGSERPSGFSQDLQSFQQENAKLRPDTQEFRQRPGAFVDNFPEAEGQATSTNFNNQHQQSLKQEQSRGSTQQDFQGQFKTHVRDNSQTQNREQFRSQHRNRFPSTIRRQPLTEAKNQFQSQKGGQLDGDSRGQYQTPRSKQFSLTQERNRFRIQDSQFQAQDRSNFQGQDSRFQAQDRSNFQGQDSQFQAQDRINFQGQDSQFQAQDRSNFQGQDSQFQTQDTRQFQTQGGRQFDTQEESQMYRQDSQQEVLEGRNQFQTLEREQFQSQDRRPFRTQDNRRFQTEAGSQYQSPNRGQFSSQNRDLYLNQRNEQFQSRAQGQLQTQSDSQLKSQRRRKFQSQLIDDYETRRRNPSLPQNKVQLQDSLQGTRFQGQKNYQFDRQQTATTGDNTYDNKRYSDDSLSSTIDQSEYPTRRYGTGIQRQTIVGDGVYPKTIGNQRYGARDTVILEPHPPQRRNFAPVNSDNSRSSNYHQQDVPQIDSIDQRAQAQTEADTLQDGTFQASVKYSDRSSQHVQTPKLSQTTNFQSRQQSTNQEQVAPSERFQASNSLRERHQDDRNQPLSVSPQFQNEDVTQTSQNPAAPTEAKFYGPIHEEETPRRPQVSASVLQRSNFQTVAEPHPQA